MPPESRHVLLPVRDLTLTREWSVGRVRLLPSGAARPLVVAARDAAAGSAPQWYDEHIDSVAARFDDMTVAEVIGAEPTDAYEHVADALAVLRLLQHQQAPMVDTDWQTFGLPGQVAQWHVEFIDLTSWPGDGFFRGGAVPGWTFSDDDYDAFHADPGLQFLSRALAKDERTRLEQRAILAARLLSTSTLEQNPDQKLLSAVTALEVMLGDDDSTGSQKYRLARRHAFLTCLVLSGSMCGRDRPSCPYLALDPADGTQRQEITALVRRARSDARVRCTMHQDVVVAYDARNRAVHEGTAGADLTTVRTMLDPIYRWLVPAVLRWYAACNGDDLQQLDEEIARVVRDRPPETIPDDAVPR